MPAFLARPPLLALRFVFTIGGDDAIWFLSSTAQGAPFCPNDWSILPGNQKNDRFAFRHGQGGAPDIFYPTRPWLLRNPPGSGGVVYRQCDATCNLRVRKFSISSLPPEASFHFFCGPKHYRVCLLANMFSASRQRGRLSLWVFPSADFSVRSTQWARRPAKPASFELFSLH